jgi:MFS family permease
MRPNTYKNYLLIVLMVILAFSYVDRMIFGLVLDGIKTELRLTDTQMGLLSGIGFALFFALMGLPIARWADRGNRVTIIALTTGLWSVAVSLCGLAGSFLHLFLVRIGIAVGESGCGPPAHSLIPEYFSRAERARAMARYMLGLPIGLTTGYFVGGWLNELYGWRTTFIIVGLPGLVLASLAAFTLREPRRLAVVAPAASAQPAENRARFKDVGAVLWSRSTYRHLLLAFLTWYFFGWGLVQWMPTFFIRSHGMPSAELGTWMAITHGAVGLLGTWLGGEWVSRYAARNERLQLVGLAVIFLLYAVFSATVHVVPNHYWAFAVFASANIVGFTAGGPLMAMVQTLVAPRIRATALALITLLPSFVGAGLGPLGVGALSDALQPWAGQQESLRYAMLIYCPGFAWTAWHLWRASRTVTRDVELAQTDHEHASGGSPDGGPASNDDAPLGRASLRANT